MLGLRGPGPWPPRLAYMLSPVLPAVRRPDLGDPAALGRAALHAWASPSWPSAAAGGANRRSSPWSWRWSAASTPAPSSTSASRRCSGSSTPSSSCASPPGATPSATGLRIGVLTLGACLWWIAGLEVEAAYGVNVLKFTETVPSTSATSNASEVIRGLGYWYFYGSDHLGPWTNAAVRYTQNITLLATSYAVPVVALVAAAFVRWRERAFFLVLLFVGLVLSVGPFPFTDPTRVGGWLKSFMTDTTAGLALRSTDRATPLVLLALAMLLGQRSRALWRRLSGRRDRRPRSSSAGLVVANNPSLFNGDTSPTTSPSRRRCPPTRWPPSPT